MLQRHRFILIMAAGLIAAVTAMAAVPNQITYQGRLTDENGVTVVDDNYNIIFNIYGIDVGGLALWSDTMVVATHSGLFTALLGSERALSPAIFNGTTRYLGIALLGDAEMTPRTPIVSVPYAMVAGNVVTGDVDCHTCDTVFVNAVGPDSIVATNADTAVWISNYGDDARGALSVLVQGSNNSAGVTGLKSSGVNLGSGEFPAYGAKFFATANSGDAFGAYADVTANSEPYAAYGFYGRAENYSANGTAFGGYFATDGADPSTHIAVYGRSISHGFADAIGIYAAGLSTEDGVLTGGKFSTSYSGTGRRFGVYADSKANNDTTVTGVYGFASNDGNGQVRGGEFEAGTGGIGRHYGVFTTTEADNNNLSYGIHAYAKNLAVIIPYRLYLAILWNK